MLRCSGGNKLREIPPLIERLRNLRELNVANNLLEFLPSEIMSLNLRSFVIDPNPFLINVTEANRYGPIKRIHKINSLGELALRALLEPAMEESRSNSKLSMLAEDFRRKNKTVLEAYYDLPLSAEMELSPTLTDILSSCVPGSIAYSIFANITPRGSAGAGRPTVPQHSIPCLSECPSPRHRVVQPGEAYRKPVYIVHAEERFSWEKEVAGQRVGGEQGVPIRWRGCSPGCLDFLESTFDEGWGVDDMNVDFKVAQIGDDIMKSCTDAATPIVGPEFSSEGFEFDDDD